MRRSAGRDLDSKAIAHAQLTRFARAVSNRSSAELCEIAGTNPELIREWISELRQRRDELKSEVRDLDGALDSLLDARGHASRSAA